MLTYILSMTAFMLQVIVAETTWSCKGCNVYYLLDPLQGNFANSCSTQQSLVGILILVMFAWK